MMKTNTLKEWLAESKWDITEFMEYELEFASDDDLADQLDDWFGSTNWRKSGQRFESIGQDPGGGIVAAWHRPNDDGPAPIVFFGRDDELHVLADSPQLWAFMVAHAPDISWLDPARNSILGDDPNHAPESLEEYQERVKETFGEIPSFDDLIATLKPTDDALFEWVSSVAPDREVARRR